MHGKYHRVGPVSIYPRLILLCICEIWGSPPTHASVFWGGGEGLANRDSATPPFCSRWTISTSLERECLAAARANDLKRTHVAPTIINALSCGLSL